MVQRLRRDSYQSPARVQRSVTWKKKKSVRGGIEWERILERELGERRNI